MSSNESSGYQDIWEREHLKQRQSTFNDLLCEGLSNKEQDFGENQVLMEIFFQKMLEPLERDYPEITEPFNVHLAQAKKHGNTFQERFGWLLVQFNQLKLLVGSEATIIEHLSTEERKLFEELRSYLTTGVVTGSDEDDIHPKPGKPVVVN